MKTELVTQTEFAKLCNVNMGSVSFAINNTLKPAMHDRKINVNHPLVKEYMSVERGEGPSKGKYHSKRKLKSFNDFVDGSQDKQINGNDDSDSYDLMHLEKLDADSQVNNKPAQQRETVVTQPTNMPPETKIVEPEYEKRIGYGIQPIPADIYEYRNLSLQQICDRHGDADGFMNWLKPQKILQEITTTTLKNEQMLGNLVKRDVVKAGLIDPIDEMCTRLLTDAARTVTARIMSLTKSGATVADCEDVFVKGVNAHIKSMKSKLKKTLNEMDK